MLQQDEVISRLKNVGNRDVLNGERLGDLNLSGQEIDFCLNLTGARIGGSVDLSHARLHRGIRAPMAFFEGTVEARHCEMMGDVSFTNAYFASTVDLSWAIVRGKFWAWRARFHGDATFFQLVCKQGDTSNLEYVFPGELNFSWAWFLGKALFERGRFEGPVFFWRTRFFDNCSFNESSFARGAVFMGKVSEICLDYHEIGPDFCRKLEAAGLLRPANEGWMLVNGREVPFYYHLNNINSLQELEGRMNQVGLSPEEQGHLATLYHMHAGRMFAKEASLQNMGFEQPKQIKFIGVNASEWSLAGTDTSAISFFNADEQPVPEKAGLGYVYQTVFISYGGPDEAVARRLHDALRSAGVAAYFYKEDAVPGRLIDDEMVSGIAQHDRVLFVCSQSAPQRPGWRFELKQAFKKESQEGRGTIALPVSIDEGLWTEWPSEIEPFRADLIARNVADFRGALDNVDRFNEQLARLLKALRSRKAEE
ncbi:MAG: toll/interleukin-1 receptor domain-containing protein [Acidobacteriia bacterium]|nr:toll/interleukin-1 receptor domain-containing protein [Terriglobia bacterium]